MSELKTSVIRHPANNPLIMRREWAVRAIRRSREKGARREEAVECAAEILAIFEYHTNNPFANSLLRDLSKRALVRKGVLRELGGWLPYSVAYIEECLFEGRGKDCIVKSLAILLEMRFTSQNVPQDLPNFYASGVMKWYRLNVDIINKWIDTFYGGEIDTDDLDSFTEPIKVTVPSEVEKKPPTQNLRDLYGGQKQTILTICLFHRHIHNKSVKYVYDKTRMNAVLERLREGRTLSQFGQAIIGCALSEFHQGKNPSSQLYDDIAKYICINAEKFERMVGIAESHGVTEEVAYNEFKKVIANGVSKYSKILKKEEVKTLTHLAPRRSIVDISPAEAFMYKTFAKEMATYLTIPNSLPVYFENYRESERLVELSQGLTNDDVMNECLVESVKVFVPYLDGNALTRIAKFSKKLTEMLALKQE